jgi:VWFA-related protein
MKTLLARSRWLQLLVPVLTAPTLGGWFQASTPSRQELPAATIRVSTRLVLVDVVVTDKQGKPVSGLRRDDFTLEENGKAQKVAIYTAPEEHSAAAAPAPPPGIYSNRAQYRSPGGPITVLLLDALNTPFQDQAYARRQMLRFVKEQYKPGQRAAVFTLTGSLNVLQDFTTDPQILYNALQHYIPEPQTFASAGGPATSLASGTASASSTGSAIDASTPPATPSGNVGLRPAGEAAASAMAALRSFEGAQAAYRDEQRTVITLEALNSLGRMLGGLPGRKNIIWVTGTLPFSLVPENRTVSDAELAEDLPSLNTRRVGEHSEGSMAAANRQSNAQQIRETEARLANAQVAIYPVDARGLSISLSIDSQETMREMARETGGRAYVNQNEIKEGVARAFDDDAATYTLGYYPENKKWDGKYRQIKVKVARDGVEARNRRGYYAIDPTQQKGYNPEAEVAAALRDVVPATMVAFSTRIQPPATNSVKGKIGVDFLVDASTVSSEDASGGKKLNLAFYASIFSPAGQILGNRSMKVDRAFDAATYEQIRQHGLMMHMDLDPLPGKNQLRLAVQDNRTGLVGSLDAPAPTP